MVRPNPRGNKRIGRFGRPARGPARKNQTWARRPSHGERRPKGQKNSNARSASKRQRRMLPPVRPALSDCDEAVFATPGVVLRGKPCAPCFSDDQPLAPELLAGRLPLPPPPPPPRLHPLLRARGPEGHPAGPPARERTRKPIPPLGARTQI